MLFSGLKKIKVYEVFCLLISSLSAVATSFAAYFSYQAIQSANAEAAFNRQYVQRTQKLREVNIMRNVATKLKIAEDIFRDCTPNSTMSLYQPMNCNNKTDYERYERNAQDAAQELLKYLGTSSLNLKSETLMIGLQKRLGGSAYIYMESDLKSFISDLDNLAGKLNSLDKVSYGREL